MTVYKEDAENYNALAWHTPNHNGRYEYQPGDEFYDKIINWLKSLSGNTRYGPVEDSQNGNRCGTKRMRCSDEYDVVASYFPDTRGVNYIFRKVYEYAI